MRRYAAVFVAAVAFAAATPAVRAQSAGVYTTQAVASFQQTRGNYASSNLARVRGLALQLNANGTFVLAMPDTWYGTFTGRLTKVGNQLRFTGLRTLYTGAGYNFAQVQGVVTVVNGQTVLVLASASGNSVAAVVNNTNFGSMASNGYTAVIVLRKVR